MKEQKEVSIFNSISELADYIGRILIENLSTKGEGQYLSLALSGGSTPEQIFKYLSIHYKELVNWNKIKFFWVDERCVPPGDKESNYKMTCESLFENLNISKDNIYRIYGEADPKSESKRYSNILSKNVAPENNFPRFDVVLLGLGEDGHTASIFPDKLDLFETQEFCMVAVHPESGQKRITLTGKVINNAKNVLFIITGNNKAKIAAEVIEKKNKILPASFIHPVKGSLKWLLDSEAAKFLSE